MRFLPRRNAVRTLASGVHSRERGGPSIEYLAILALVGIVLVTLWMALWPYGHPVYDFPPSPAPSPS